MTQLFNKKSQTYKRRVLRKQSPAPELILWNALRNRKIGGKKFKRQVSVGRYVVDFYCPELRLVIEIDGAYHNVAEIKAYDASRKFFIENLGIHCLRFSNDEIKNNLENVLGKIHSSSLSLRRRGIEDEV